MKPDLEVLARRALACKNWRWMPGMLAWRLTHRKEWIQVRFVEGLDVHAELADPKVIERTPSKTLLVASGHTVVDGWTKVDELLPDFSDPATLGCLLVLVRELRGKETWVQYEDEWNCWLVEDDTVYSYSGKSEAETLLIALEKIL